MAHGVCACASFPPGLSVNSPSFKWSAWPVLSERTRRVTETRVTFFPPLDFFLRLHKLFEIFDPVKLQYCQKTHTHTRSCPWLQQAVNQIWTNNAASLRLQRQKGIFIRREVLEPNPSVNSSALILRLHLVSTAPLSPLCSHLCSDIFQIVGPGLSFVSSPVCVSWSLCTCLCEVFHLRKRRQQKRIWVSAFLWGKWEENSPLIDNCHVRGGLFRYVKTSWRWEGWEV